MAASPSPCSLKLVSSTDALFIALLKTATILRLTATSASSVAGAVEVTASSAITTGSGSLLLALELLLSEQADKDSANKTRKALNRYLVIPCVKLIIFPYCFIPPIFIWADMEMSHNIYSFRDASCPRNGLFYSRETDTNAFLERLSRLEYLLATTCCR